MESLRKQVFVFTPEVLEVTPEHECGSHSGQVLGVTPEQVFGVTPEQVFGITPEQVFGVTPEQVFGVTPELE